MDKVETKKLKKLKKEATIESSEAVDEVFSSLKKEKRKEITDDHEGEKIKAKKLKKVEVSSKDDVKIYIHNDEEEEEEVVTRRRTRSLSNADEEYPVGLTIEQFQKTNQLSITGKSLSGSGLYECPAPMTAFNSTPFPPPIRRALESAGFANPTPTQAQAWPIALSGRDVITVAKTGSGKTCGFLLPAFHRLLTEGHLDRRRGHPAILVLAPTRELACQIEEEAAKFGKTSNIRSACLYGGAPKSLQIRKLQQGVEVVIATPGRLNDLLEMGVVKLEQVMFLVFDEADRMLDMGFEPQIRKIAEYLPKQRQSMMFTATWPREVQALALDFLVNPIEIKFGDVNNLNANKDIKQVIKVVQDNQKAETLEEVLKEINPSGDVAKVPKTIIFVSRKYACDDLANSLWNKGYSVDSLHGDKQQFMRTRVMDSFKRSSLRILVATDVAARGLDVKDIEVVVNYDFPAGMSGVEDYVHRIGRTARAGATGSAYTFFTAADAKRAGQLIGVLKRANQEVPEALQRFAGSGGRYGSGSFGGRGGGGRGGGRGGFGRGGGGGGRFGGGGGGFGRGGGGGGGGFGSSGSSFGGSRKW